jgi:hypothetical protein
MLAFFISRAHFSIIDLRYYLAFLLHYGRQTRGIFADLGLYRGLLSPLVV